MARCRRPSASCTPRERQQAALERRLAGRERHLAARNQVLEQRLAERAAIDTHSKFSVADRSGRIIEVNDEFCRICGYDRDELVGQFHSILSSGVHDEAFWSAMWRTIASGRPWRGEICNRAKDGSLHWVDSTFAPLCGAMRFAQVVVKPADKPA